MEEERKKRNVNIRIPEEIYEYLERKAALSEYGIVGIGTIAGRWVEERYRRELYDEQHGGGSDRHSDRRRAGDRRGLTMAPRNGHKKSSGAS